jgi:hypothetical protein
VKVFVKFKPSKRDSNITFGVCDVRTHYVQRSIHHLAPLTFQHQDAYQRSSETWQGTGGLSGCN